jgi:hypothetical protein
MKHNTLDALQRVAQVRPEQSRTAPMTRSERLERWAELLERQPRRLLATFPGTEYQTAERRDVMRGDDSPISVAFGDPILRSEGMRDDTYGEAKRFFEVSDWQLHDILCYCHYGASMTAETAARGVRAAIHSRNAAGLLSRVRQAISG